METNECMHIESEEQEGARVVHVAGGLTLETAGRLQAVLVDALRPGAMVRLEAGEISRVDLCGLQLICSAHRTFRIKGACFELGETSEALRDAASAAGYQAIRSVCPFRKDLPCLWKW